MSWVIVIVVTAALLAILTGAYLGLITGALPIDLRIGRRLRPLGPQVVTIAAPPDIVMDVIAAPYLGWQTRAVAEKIRILERGTDMVLAAHRTPLRGRLVAATWERTVAHALATITTEAERRQRAAPSAQSTRPATSTQPPDP